MRLPVILTIILLFLIPFLYILEKIWEHEKVFYSVEEYPEVKLLEDSWEILRNDIPEFDPNDKNIFCREKSAWNNKKGGDLFDRLKDNKSWVKGWWKDVEWYQFPLMYHGKPVGHAEKVCPNAVKVLKQIPQIQIAGYALLLPKTTMPIHTDETGKRNYSMALNMGLITDDASLYVMNNKGLYQRFKHIDGKAVVFDSNNKHYASNDVDKIRIILYVDFKTDTITGRRVSGRKLASSIGYPTVNLKLDRKTDCGFYVGDSEYGKAMIGVDHTGYFAECHFKQFNKVVDEKDRLHFYNMTTLGEPDGGILGTFMMGCKGKNKL